MRELPRSGFVCAQHGGDEQVKILGEAGRSDPEQTARRRNRETGPAVRLALKEAGSRNRESTNRKHPLQRGGVRRIRGGASQGKRTRDRELSRPKVSVVDPTTMRGTPPSLPGEISPHARKGDAPRRCGARSQQRPYESEAHRQGWRPAYCKPEGQRRTKGRTEGRASQP